MSKLIEFNELEHLLGKNYILLCGSAISSRPIIVQPEKSRPFLPMVTDVTCSFFKSVATFQDNHPANGYFEKYTSELISGMYRETRLQIKFEEFLWKIEPILGKVNINKMLEMLFYCDNDQYDINHSAIAKLIKSGKVPVCLTTNFDNAIENAFNKNSITVISYPKHPKNIWKYKTPILIKLHGDVNSNSYNATIPSLLEAERLANYNYIQKYFSTSTILIAGYSGYGDIDIAPHIEQISKMGANIIWIVKDEFTPPNSSAKFHYISDLWSDSPEKNILIKLAKLEGHLDFDNPNSPNWENRVQLMINKLDSEQKRKLILESFYMMNGGPYFHLLHLNKWSQELVMNDNQKLDYALRFISRGIYLSAIKILKSINLQNKNLEFITEWKIWYGFAIWRSASSKLAIKTFSFFVDNFVNKIPNELLSQGLRLYLNAAQDILTGTSNIKKRIELYKDLKINEVIAKINSIYINDYRNEIQIILSTNIINLLVGEKYYFEKVKDAFNRSMNLHDWPIAQQVAQIMVEMNYEEGLNAIKKVDQQILFRVNKKYYRKNLTSLWDAKASPYFRIGPLLDSKFFRTIKSLCTEIRYQIKKYYWFVTFKWRVIVIEKNLPIKKTKNTISFRIYKALIQKF